MTAAGLSEVLSGLASELNGEQLASLTTILDGLTGALSGTGLSELKGTLQTLLGGLSEGELSTVLGTLEGALSGTDLTELQELQGKLGSLTSPELTEELETLVGGLDPSQVSTLLGGLFGVAVDPSQLQTLLDELTGGLTLSPTSIESVAGQLGMPAETLAEGLGAPTASASMLTSELGPEGQVLGVLDKAGKLALTVLKPEGELGGGSEGGGSEGGGGGQGGSGGTGGGSAGSGGSGGPASSGTGLTVTVNVVPPGTSQSSTRATAGAAKKLSKIKIVTHKVKRDVATIVAQVPAAGKVTLGEGRQVRHPHGREGGARHAQGEALQGGSRLPASPSRATESDAHGLLQAHRPDGLLGEGHRYVRIGSTAARDLLGNAGAHRCLRR